MIRDRQSGVRLIKPQLTLTQPAKSAKTTLRVNAPDAEKVPLPYAWSLGPGEDPFSA